MMFKRFWWVFLVGLIVGPLLGGVLGGLIGYVMPKKFESTVTLQVRSRIPSTEVSPGLVARNLTDKSPRFFPTEFEVIKARKTLDMVIDDLDLTDRWGEDKETVRRTLENMISAQNVRGTDLIEIQVRTSNSEDARLIAESVSKAYRARRAELERRNWGNALLQLREAVQAQEDVVEEKRMTLTEIIKSEGVTYNDNGHASGDFTALAEQKILLESQIETLLRYDGDQLFTYASSLQLPENIIRQLYPQYLDAKRQLDAMITSDLGAQHPNFEQQQEIVEGMRRDLGEGTAALRETLKARLEAIKEKLPQEASEVATGIARQTFDDARADFETAQVLLNQLRIKLVAGEMHTKVAWDAVTIHSAAVQPSAPVSPNLPLWLLIGAAVGLGFGVLAPLILIPILHRVFPPGL